MNMDCPCDKCQNSRVMRGECVVPPPTANEYSVVVVSAGQSKPLPTTKDFDEALALLKEAEFMVGTDAVKFCPVCTSKSHCAADCRLAAFLTKWVQK